MIENTKNNIVTIQLGESVSSTIPSLLYTNKQHDIYTLNSKTGLVFLFNYGVLVFWGVTKDEREKISAAILPYILEPTTSLNIESYTYSIDSTLNFSIKNDHVIIPDTTTDIRLALSHALAQSAKLTFFEDSAEQLISSNRHIAKKLSHTGKINMSRKSLSQLRGILFDTSCDITLHFNLLDKPNFFWNYPELDDYYVKLSQYLEINQRVHLLNDKLAMIRELLDMLAEEQNHKHSSFLEWIIIILIAIEIILFIFSGH